jgi:hypothetical protein
VRSRIATVVAACLLAVCVPAGGTAAHGDDPRVTIAVASLAPGGALTVHGFDFPYEDDVTLALRGASGDTEIGTVTSDLEGAFTHTVTVPVEQPLGAYVVVASDSHHTVTSTPFLIDGAPLVEDDGARIDEGDSLLAPMPTVGAVTAAATPAAATVASGGRLADEDDSGTSAAAVLAVAGVVVIGVAMLAWLLLRQRRIQRRVRTADNPV